MRLQRGSITLTRGGPRKQLMRTDLLCAVMRRRNLNEACGTEARIWGPSAGIRSL